MQNAFITGMTEILRYRQKGLALSMRNGLPPCKDFLSIMQMIMILSQTNGSFTNRIFLNKEGSNKNISKISL